MHLPSFESSESDIRYRLSVPKTSLDDILNKPEIPKTKSTYTSRQVVMSTLRALAYLLKQLKSFDLHNSYSKPSPIQYWSIQPLELFIISTGGLLASRVPPYDEATFNEATLIVTTLVLPTLEKFCSIWPMAYDYKTKLATLLASLQPNL